MEKGKWLKQLGISLVAIAMGVYILMQISIGVGADVEVENATYASVRATTEMEAFLFRNEAVIPRTSAGTVCYFVDDGKKVQSGEHIASIYSDATDASIQQRIYDIDARIDVLSRSSVSEGTTTSDLAIISQTIDDLRLSYLKAVQGGNLSGALRYKDELMVQMNRSRALSQKLDSYDAQIHKLTQEKTELEQSLVGESIAVNAPSSGYYYSTTDGYEGIFTMERLSSMTANGFDSLSQSLPDSTIIAASAGKIVVDATWYLLCRSDKRTAAELSQGDSCTVIFPFSSGIELTMTYEKKFVQTDTDICLLLLSCARTPEGFSYTRSQTVELVGKTYQGLSIPTQALRKNGDRTGVYALKGNVVVFKETEVLCRQNGYYICAIPINPEYPGRNDKAYISPTRLSLYDTVIISGTGVYEGALLQ